MWKNYRGGKPLHRHINHHINTCTDVSLHVINLTDWHVRQPLGRLLLACPTSRLARGHESQQVRRVVVLMPWKKNIVQMRSPLSGSHRSSSWAEANALNWFTTKNHYRPYFDDPFVWHGGINLSILSTLHRWLCILIWCRWYPPLVRRITHHPHTKV